MKLAISLSCLFFVTQAGTSFAAASEEEQVVEAISCSHGQDVRKLEISTKGAGCVLHYMKAGKNQQIAKANRGVDVCKDRLAQVRKTLEGSSYQCK